jgi:hypothetical protein
MPEVSQGTEKPWHPQCPTCAVSMWLVEIEKMGPVERRHFECKVCDGKAILPVDRNAA